MSEIVDYITARAVWDYSSLMDFDEDECIDSYHISGDIRDVYNDEYKLTPVGKSPSLESINDKYVACRAWFDACYIVRRDCNNEWFVKLDTRNTQINQYIKDSLGEIVHFREKNNVLYIHGVNLCEIFHIMYRNAKIYHKEAYNFFKKCAFGFDNDPVPKFRFKLTDSLAVAPKKNKQSDSGFDLVLVKKIKEANGVEFFDTCVQLAPPLGYYFDLVGRSSISKTGYTLANNVGIIDQSYRGNVIVALFKHNKDMPDLDLPCRLVQIIPRSVEGMEMEQDDDLNGTSRASGGFGSSGR